MELIVFDVMRPLTAGATMRAAPHRNKAWHECRPTTRILVLLGIPWQLLTITSSGEAVMGYVAPQTCGLQHPYTNGDHDDYV